MNDLRIGMNLLWLRPGEVGGTETYIRRVLRVLAQTPDVQLHLFGTTPALDAVRPTGPRVEEYITTAASLMPAKRLVVERTWLRSVVPDELDVLHHPGGTVPFRGSSPALVTIHDLQPLDDPHNFSAIKRRFLSSAIPAAIERAELVAAPSDWVRHEIMSRFSLSPDRVVTVSAYAEPRDLGLPVAASPRLERIFEKGPVVFYPAMTMKHKNHKMLFDAFREAGHHDPDLQLVCVGSIGRDHDEICEAAAAASPRISMLGHVPRSDLDALFVRSEALVFPSLYEGFGLPILEAQHSDLPVIASNTTALPEVVGDAGRLVDPTRAKDWTEALLDRPGGEDRARQVAKGRQNAARFSADRTARQQRSAYDRLTP